MAINIKHTYSTHTHVTYLDEEMNCGLHESICGNMDEIAEHVCEVLVKHNFSYADVCSEETGELLMIVERT